MIRSAWRIWKRFRWKNLVRVWAVFMAIALVLLAQTLGIHYGATKFTLKYMARNEAIPAQNAIMGQRATNLMLVDSSQDGVDEAEAMMKQVLLDMKVPTATVDLAKTDPDDIPSLNRYRTVLIVMPELDSLGDELVSIMRWVEGGGNMMLAMTPEKTGYLDAIGPQIGIESSSYDYVMTKGIKPSKGFMLGGGHTYILSSPFESSLSLNLNGKAIVAAVGANGHTPLIWSTNSGAGRTVTCNIGIYDKVVRGFYASAFSLLGSATAYPVINSAAFYLDDFPSPVPSGDGTYIKRDYGMNIADFYSKVWWPDLTKLAERYGIRFTGVMIENYGDDTKDAPVRQTDESRFSYFGGLLLKQNGEIGYHGYNHQPLVLPNTDYGDEYAYHQWPNRKAIVASLRELIAFQKSVLPAATASVYVPPSNIMSKEGRQVIGRDIPEIRAIASTYLPSDSKLPYVQEFGVADDGIVEAPRIVSGGMVGDDYMRLAAESELNMHFVSTHFMHPDDMLDPDRGAKEGWVVYRKGLENYLDWLEASDGYGMRVRGAALLRIDRHDEGILRCMGVRSGQFQRPGMAAVPREPRNAWQDSRRKADQDDRKPVSHQSHGFHGAHRPQKRGSGMRICLVLEGCYPYVHGGVSTWMHSYITAMKEHEFVLWVIGAKAKDRGKFVYDLPSNVVEVHEVFLDDALRLSGEHAKVIFTDEEVKALRELVNLSDPDWDVLFNLFHNKGVHPLSFLQSNEFIDLFTKICMEEYPYVAYADAFHTVRSMLLPVLYLMTGEVPKAQIYHAISTGYGGLLACLGGSINHAPVLLTEHGIYTREREEEILSAEWVAPAFRQRWIRFFAMLSQEIYRRAWRVTSLFGRARQTQIDMGAPASKCLVIPNGIQYERFCDIPLKPEDGWVDIGAVVRLAPIKDVKTLIHAFSELSNRVDNVRLHILGGVDDQDYADECYKLVKQLEVKNLEFTGRVNVVEYMRKLDFTVLTSISEGQPLSVLESFAAARPCVTTDVGCCRELLEGEEGDNLGVAGFYVPPMYREGLARAMERMCASRKLREAMGQVGRERVKTYYRHERMLDEYRALYLDTADHYGLEH